MSSERTYWIALAMCPGVGARLFKALLAKFGSPQSVFGSTVEELTRIPRMTEAMARQILSVSVDRVVEEVLSLENESIDIVTQVDENFPVNLKAAFDAPPILFVRGGYLSQDVNAVAVIGTREASKRGKDLAKKLAAEFAQQGWTVVSGLARGIDTVAHQGALAGEGRTIAVLGSGIRNIHPKRNLLLAQEIVRSGAVISEQHPNAPPRGPYLMARDRIVSGLSKAVIVVEAGEQSGSLDTAKKAYKQNRLVFAVDTGSSGTNQLIAEEASAISPTSFNVVEIIADINNNLELDFTPQIELFENK
ncbi:MAG: DNA-processing protein DprA [bacterium]